MQALAFYYERSEIAGDRFYQRFLETLRNISDFPQRVPLRGRNRYFPVQGFPYSIVTDAISERIVALAHDARRPGFWRTGQ